MIIFEFIFRSDLHPGLIRVTLPVDRPFIYPVDIDAARSTAIAYLAGQPGKKGAGKAELGLVACRHLLTLGCEVISEEMNEGMG